MYCIIYIHTDVYIYMYYIYVYIYIYIYILTNLRSDVKLSKMFQTKPNQRVFYLFAYQKIPSQDQLAAVYSKFL